MPFISIYIPIYNGGSILKFFKVGHIDKELATFRVLGEQATEQNDKMLIAEHQLNHELVNKNLFFYQHPKIRKDLFFFVKIFFEFLPLSLLRSP